MIAPSSNINPQPLPVNGSREAAQDHGREGAPRENAREYAGEQPSKVVAFRNQSPASSPARLEIPENINDLSVPEAARFYVENLGLAVIPLHPITNARVKKPGRQPMIKGYRLKKVADMTKKYLADSFPKRTDRNLGAVLQDQLVWIDLDAKQDEGKSADEWLARYPYFQEHPRVRTKHGLHIPVVIHDLPANTKKLVHKVSEKLVIEILTPPHPVTLPPSLRADGKPYVWEKTGEIAVVSWKDLRTQLEIPEKKPGRPKKPRPLTHRFKGDLRTLDFRALLCEKGMLGDCLDETEGKYAARCPWESEHSDRHYDIQSDTAVWLNPGKMPAFKCLHAHCEYRKIDQMLEFLDTQDTGIVDRFCSERRAYGHEEAGYPRDRPLVRHPGDSRLVSDVSQELAKFIAPRHQWFQRSGTICEVTKDPKSDRVGFRAITAVSACGGIERFVTPVVPRVIEGESELVPHSFDAKGIAPLLHAPQFIDNLPVIKRILSASLPILRQGQIVLPQPGYNPDLRVYLRPDAPQMVSMTVAEAKRVFDDILGDFCFESLQDRIHAIARLITPFVRGIMGWTVRVPLWLFIANRPRAGKDFLSGVASILFTGEIIEDAPLERNSEETRKRITAASMAGRPVMHFANCQGYIEDAALIGAVTARVIRVRNLGSTAAEADLELPNEIEFSLSANQGVTYREDIEPRSRRISLAFFEEDPNKRQFRRPDLHGYVRANRGLILGAVDTLVNEWIRRGMPDGTTRFTSFPEWARTVGGIMQANNLGDPCLPHESELKVGGDLRERALRAVYGLGFQKWPDQWITKEDLFKALADADDEDLLWFGPWTGDDAKGTKNKAGMALKAFNRRVLGGIRLEIDEQGKGARQKVRFTAGGEAHPEGGNLGNLGNLGNPALTDGNNGVVDDAINGYNKSCRAGALEVSQLSQVSHLDFHLVTNAGEFASIVALVGSAEAVALNTKTYGPGKAGGLEPRLGCIRLLQLAVPGHAPWVIDIMRTGGDLGPLHDALEKTELIAHNAQFDLPFLQQHLDLRPTRVFCTLTASKLLTNGRKDRNDLFSVLDRHLGLPAYPDFAASDWGTRELSSEQLDYSALDVRHLHDLRQVLAQELDMNGLSRVAQLEFELLPVVTDIVAAGLPIDATDLTTQREQTLKAAADLKQAMRNHLGNPGFNPASASQAKAALLTEGLDLPGTSADALAPHSDDPFVRMLLDWRHAAKLGQMLTSLGESLSPDGRIHAKLNPLGAETGRFSSSKPNLQNIPRGVRGMIRPAPGHVFIKADYSQIDLRAAAALVGEEKMLESFRNGGDIHTLTASWITGKPVAEVTPGERQEAKAANFGFLYGQRAEGFSRQALKDYGIDFSAGRAEELRRSYFKAYPGLARWHSESSRKARRGLTEVRTRTGRRRLIPSGASEWDRFTAEVNTPVQGVAADGMKLALIRLYRELPEGARIVLTVHDDVLIECRQDLAEVLKPLTEKIMSEEMGSLLPEVPIVVEAEILNAWK